MEDTPRNAERHAAAIRARRLELGWTQHHLAHQAGISVATIRKLEAGTHTYYRALTLVPLCQALGWPTTSLDDLIADQAQNSNGDTAAYFIDGNARTDPGLVAAFNGELAQLTDNELAEVLEFTRQLRQQRR